MSSMLTWLHHGGMPMLETAVEIWCSGYDIASVPGGLRSYRAERVSSLNVALVIPIIVGRVATKQYQRFECLS